MPDEHAQLTTDFGAPVADNQDSVAESKCGPNVWFLEKLATFDREVIHERRMHAKGAHPHGHQRHHRLHADCAAPVATSLL